MQNLTSIPPPTDGIRISGVCASPAPKGSRPWPVDKQEAKLGVFPGEGTSSQPLPPVEEHCEWDFP